MTKKMVEFQKYADDLVYANTLGILLDNVQKYVSKYGSDIKLDIDSGYSDISVKITLEREETDQEYQKRLKQEAREASKSLAKKQRQEEKERKEFERLKKKYGDN